MRILKSALVLLLLGCASCKCCRSGSHAVAKSKTDLTGTWRVTAGQRSERTMKLVQKGTVLTGEVDAGDITGKIKGSNVTLELDDGNTKGTGVVTGSFMEGRYETEGEDPGKWEAERVEDGEE